MRFFVVPGIGQLELNGQRSSERVVRSPPNCAPRRPPSATSVTPALLMPPPQGHCEKGWAPVCLTANDGPLPTDYPGPHFRERANDDNDVGLFYPSNLGLITAASAIKSRSHPASLTMKLDASFGTHFLIRGQIRICKTTGNFFDCIDLGMEG